MLFLEGLSSDEADSTTWYSNFYGDEEFILTFHAVISNIRNHFCNAMSLQSVRNHSGKIHFRSLLYPGTTAFMHLHDGGQDDALITMTGLNHSTFHKLLTIFSPIFYQYTPHVDSGSNISQLLPFSG